MRHLTIAITALSLSAAIVASCRTTSIRPSSDVRIIGSEPLLPDVDASSVVLIQPDGRPYCSGALIAPRLVITAGHCAFNRALKVAGNLKLGFTSRWRDRPKLSATHVFIHSGFYGLTGNKLYAELVRDSTRAFFDLQFAVALKHAPESAVTRYNAAKSGSTNDLAPAEAAVENAASDHPDESVFARYMTDLNDLYTKREWPIVRSDVALIVLSENAPDSARPIALVSPSTPGTDILTRPGSHYSAGFGATRLFDSEWKSLPAESRGQLGQVQVFPMPIGKGGDDLAPYRTDFRQGRMVCYGDSGGPFVTVINNQSTLVGLTQSGWARHGEMCSRLGFATTLAPYASAIQCVSRSVAGEANSESCLKPWTRLEAALAEKAD